MPGGELKMETGMAHPSPFCVIAHPYMILYSNRSGSTQLLPPEASGCLLTEVPSGRSRGEPEAIGRGKAPGHL